MLILVTGATGYIASRLIPRLLDRGHRVRALARRPHQLDGRPWSRLVEVFPADVTDASSLAPALEGVHSAYYLIHNMSSGRGYTERELEGARNFASACETAGVRHIIYLGGLADPEQRLAPHLRSRIETGVVLRAGGVPVTEFRAGVIVGSGSISFEMIRFMTELFPIIPGPRWLNNKSQPIATQNVIDYLLAALDHRDSHGQVFEIGGPEAAAYGDLMLRYARLRGLKRRLLLLPHVPVWFMALGIDLVTPVPHPIAHALVGGLGADSIVLHDEALRVFPEVTLLDFDSAAREALTHLHPARIERVWEDGTRSTKSLRHEGFFIRQLPPSDSHFPSDCRLAGWQTEAIEPNQYLLLRKSHSFGDEWLEYRTTNFHKPLFDSTSSNHPSLRAFAAKQSHGLRRLLRREDRPPRNDGETGGLVSTSFFAPRGSLGFIYALIQKPVFCQKTGF